MKLIIVCALHCNDSTDVYRVSAHVAIICLHSVEHADVTMIAGAPSDSGEIFMCKLRSLVTVQSSGKALSRDVFILISFFLLSLSALSIACSYILLQIMWR
jgi:hypothetical protein